MPKRSKTESAKSKAETATALAGLGGAIGSVFTPAGGAIGAGIGGLTGLIIGDKTTVFPIDMIAVPAFEYSGIPERYSFVVYIKAGETLVPTGGNVQDMGENMDIETALQSIESNLDKPKVLTAYQKRYQRAFKKVKSDFKKKDGSWKSNGFKRAVREAHRIAKGGKK